MDQFPINREIEAFLKVRTESFCEIHEKPLEYFCKNDEINICQVCIIFGKHKDHLYILKKEFQNEIQQRFKAIVQKAKELEDEPLSSNTGSF